MLAVTSVREESQGEIWLTRDDSEDWLWILMKLPILIHQDRRLGPSGLFQGSSDLELAKMPLHLCRVPATFFFPYVTYLAGTWFNHFPSFVIPKAPLNRLEGRNFLYNLARSPFELVKPSHGGSRLAWINSDGIPDLSNAVDYLRFIQYASAAKTYLLEEIRYVYDESKSSFDSQKTSLPSRFCFGEDVVDFCSTRRYLNWYIDRLNDFFSRFLEIGKQNDRNKRELCILAGWTINRLAVDALTILSTDVPYIRKWQFFGFLDVLASLRNQIDGTGSNPKNDAKTAQAMLETGFYENSILPALNEIPVEMIRKQVIAHTKSVYNSIEQMGVDEYSGVQLLRAYRNSRHGYFLQDNRKEALLLHSGRIPDHLPDLAVAFWHYIILGFPYHA